jgi:hypothetical protein
MSLELHADQPYAWLGSAQPLGLLEVAPELLPKDGPARPGALCCSVGRAPGVPAWKPAAPSPSAPQRLAERPGGDA